MQGVVANEEMINLLKCYGAGSLSYSSLQSGVEIMLEGDKGFVPFGMVHCTKATPVSLSDPICAPEYREELIRHFIEKYRTPVFVHISRDVAKIVEKHGYYINEMALETVIDVQNFSLSGPKKEFLRSQRNRAHSDGVEVHEYTSCQLDEHEVQELTANWIAYKTCPGELAFLARPAVYEDEMDVRKFYAKKNGKLIGFVYFDPMYENGKVYGYIANILRANHASYSICDALILEALKVFKEEGIRDLSLGFSPFCDVDDNPEFHFSPRKKRLFKYLFEHANHVYSFKSLAFHKKMYRPGIDGTREVKVYCASRTAMPILCFYAMLLKLGLSPVSQTTSFVCSKTTAFAHLLMTNLAHSAKAAADAVLAGIHTHAEFYAYSPLHAPAFHHRSIKNYDEDL